MGLHLYCVAPATHLPAAGLTGVAHANIVVIVEGPLSLWVSSHEERPAADVPAIREHNAVIVAAMTPRITPVPARFGQYFADERTALESLGTSHEKWLALLSRFEGAVEFGLRIFEPGRAGPADVDTEVTAASGTRYMEMLAARVRGTGAAAARASAALEAAVSGLVIDQRSEPLRTSHGVLTVAHLLHASDATAYRHAIDRVREELPGLRLLSTGPWAPYSFVSE
ncbi:MAG: GvpL/GvpF family gas vesicle protein [Longimicrobiales bacterium]